MVEQAEAAFFHWGCCLIRLVAESDPRMLKCVARLITMLILDFMKHVVSLQVVHQGS